MNPLKVRKSLSIKPETHFHSQKSPTRVHEEPLFCHTPITADGLQILLTPVPLADQIIDLLAMILTTILLGFHVLFLPTFVAELIPMIGMLPTWTGCVALVVTLRRKQQAADTTAPQIESKPPR